MKQILCAALAVILAMGFCACGAGEVAEEETTVEETTARTETTRGELSVAGAIAYEDGRQPLLVAADVPNNLYLYGLPNDRLVVMHGTSENFYVSTCAVFDWDYISPRQFMPEIKGMDLDGDGEMEIVVKNYVNWGSGVSVYDLHVLDLATLTDHHFNAQVELNKVITYTEMNPEDWENGFITFSDGKHEITQKYTFFSTYYHHVDFFFENDDIRLEAVINACLVTARVNFKDGVFTLTDISLSE